MCDVNEEESSKTYKCKNIYYYVQKREIKRLTHLPQKTKKKGKRQTVKTREVHWMQKQVGTPTEIIWSGDRFFTHKRASIYTHSKER